MAEANSKPSTGTAVPVCSQAAEHSITAATSSDATTLDSALLTKRALAAKLQIAPRTLDDWMKKGHVPYLKVKKSVRFVFSDVLRKLNEQYRVN